MEHPLIDDLKHLNDSDLNDRLADLSRKYWQTTNEHVRSQMTLILDQLKEEQRVRMQNSAQQSQDNDNKDLDNLINIS